MTYTIEIREERVGNIEVEAQTHAEAAQMALELFDEDPENNVEWYGSKASFDEMTEEDLLHEKSYMEYADYYDEHYVEEFDSCVCCGAVIPEGRIICPDCASGCQDEDEDEGDDENGRQTRCVEQRKSRFGGLASRFGRRIPRIFGR